jgi:hypothetical protein
MRKILEWLEALFWALLFVAPLYYCWFRILFG